MERSEAAKLCWQSHRNNKTRELRIEEAEPQNGRMVPIKVNDLRIFSTYLGKKVGFENSGFFCRKCLDFICSLSDESDDVTTNSWFWEFPLFQQFLLLNCSLERPVKLSEGRFHWTIAVQRRRAFFFCKEMSGVIKRQQKATASFIKLGGS